MKAGSFVEVGKIQAIIRHGTSNSTGVLSPTYNNNNRLIPHILPQNLGTFLETVNSYINKSACIRQDYTCCM